MSLPIRKLRDRQSLQQCGAIGNEFVANLRAGRYDGLDRDPPSTTGSLVGFVRRCLPERSKSPLVAPNGSNRPSMYVELAPNKLLDGRFALWFSSNRALC